jgi:hypothetical protein
MSIIEILDSENIKSNLENWIEECEKFQVWYHKLGARAVSQIEMEKAYLKIEHTIKNKVS